MLGWKEDQFICTFTLKSTIPVNIYGNITVTVSDKERVISWFNSGVYMKVCF